MPEDAAPYTAVRDRGPLTMPGQGELGQVGEIDVDAQTGAFDAGEMTITRIQQNARSLVAGSPLSPKQ